ncbi:MAG: acyltransferase family protein [Patescibacteria group bacterium]
MEDKKIITYRPDIDGLRALAVLLVVAFHASPSFFKSGFIGVDIFFVISGFLISGIILKMLKNNEFSYLEFYKRRIKRLFPALLAVLLSCLIVGWFFLFSQEYRYLGRQVFSGAGFVSNIILFLETGYFDISASMKPLIHLWSLGVEEQFYIFWPILLVFLYKRTKRLPLIIGILFLLSFALNIFLGLKDPNLSFYLPITRFWEFLSGAIIAYLNFHNDNFFSNLIERLNIFKKKKFFTPSLISWIGLILIFISLYIVNSENFYKGYVIILILGVSLLILSGKESFINRKIFSNKVLVYIGLISYPLYLWHWPLFSFARIFEGKEVPILVRLLLILLSFFLAWATYAFIEKPLRYSKNKQMPLVLCSLMFVVAVLGFAVYFNRGFDFRFPAQEKLLKNISISRSYIVSSLRGHINNKDLCKKIFPQEIPRGLCSITDSGLNRVFIIGDSHTRMVYEAYKDSLMKKGYTLVNLGISGCALPLPKSAKTNLLKKTCSDSVSQRLDIVIGEKPRAVIISNNSLYYDNKHLKSGMDTILSKLPLNIPIIWVLQTPKVPFSLSKCFKRNFFSKEYLVDCSFSKEIFYKETLDYYKKVEDLKKKYPHIILINPTEIVCPGERCEVVLNGNLLYEDLPSHISLFGSKLLGERLPIDQYLPDLKK